MKRRRIISSYFFQKNCYHGNHIMHSVAPPKSKAIVLLREQVGEIFSNSYITCYQERSSKYQSLKKFCRADETKKTYFSPIAFLKFFPTHRIFKKIGIYTHPIDLSCHRNLKNIHRPKAEILVHEVEKYGKVTVDQIPLYACARLFTRALNRVPTRAKRLGLPSRRICEFVKRRYFSVRSFCG